MKDNDKKTVYEVRKEVQDRLVELSTKILSEAFRKFLVTEYCKISDLYGTNFAEKVLENNTGLSFMVHLEGRNRMDEITINVTQEDFDDQECAFTMAASVWRTNRINDITINVIQEDEDDQAD